MFPRELPNARFKDSSILLSVMRENNDSFFEKILLKNINEEIPIDVNLTDTSAKDSPSTTRTNSSSAQTKESELLQSLKNQISSLKSEITFLREKLKEKDYVVRTLLKMKCKSIDNCNSTSCNNLPSTKPPRKHRTEISDTPAENTPKETINEPKNEKKQKKVQDKEEKPEIISTKPSDINADVTNRVFIIGASIVKHIGGYELSQRVENSKFFVKSFSGANVRYMEDYIQPTLRETPSHVLVHVGTYDVTTKQDPQQIAEGIINLAVKTKSNCDVSISSITTRGDKYLRKPVDVNRNLKDRCSEKNIHFINHGNALTVRHLNASKLHLNKRGTPVLPSQFAEAISNIIN